MQYKEIGEIIPYNVINKSCEYNCVGCKNLKRIELHDNHTVVIECELDDNEDLKSYDNNR